jgi:hypothetical protein
MLLVNFASLEVEHSQPSKKFVRLVMQTVMLTLAPLTAINCTLY